MERLEALYAEFYERLEDARECPSCATALVEWIKCGDGYALDNEGLWRLGDDPKYDHLVQDFFSVELAGYEFKPYTLDLCHRIDQLTPRREVSE